MSMTRKIFTTSSHAELDTRNDVMSVFDNISTFVKDDLEKMLAPRAKVSVAAACFSIYAFRELKAQLSQLDEFRFLFTSPTFTSENEPKAKREFYIPRLSRERSIYGSDFELKLRNELTQKAIAIECAEWIRAKATFKSNATGNAIQGFLNVASPTDNLTYMPLNGFTTIDLGCERGNNAFNFVSRIDAPQSQMFLNAFNSLWSNSSQVQDVTEAVLEGITAAYKENSPEFLYFITLYNIFSEFLDDISEDVLPNEGVGFRNSQIWEKLYDFQRDAVLAIINKLEKYNGCILADSVGLGKTFSALGVIKYYEDRNKNVLVLCPKKLAGNWNTYKGNYVNNPIACDRLRYDVLFHTDLSREKGDSNGIDLARLRWDTYDLIVIDESHNFRNGGQIYGEDKRENRYLQLLNKAIKPGVKTKVLMLSATPVNNRFTDLRNQLALAYEGMPELWSDKLETAHSINEIFRQAQREFNTWSKLPPEERTLGQLLARLDFDFFELLDSVTIARSRKHIEKYYNSDAIGKFPDRLPPISPRPSLTDLPSAINYTEIYEQLQMLSLMVYLPSNFILDSRRAKYEEKYGRNMGNTIFSQLDREKGIQRLTGIGLLKRLESSVFSFRQTLERILALNKTTIQCIDDYRDGHGDSIEYDEISKDVQEIAEDDEDSPFTVGRKVKIALEDMDFVSWRTYLSKDVDTLELLISMVGDITPVHDNKLQALKSLIDGKIAHPINGNNRKVIVFTAFTDTAKYLYENLNGYMKTRHHLHTAMISGSGDGMTTLPGKKPDMNTILTLFSPLSKEKSLLCPDNPHEIDLLIATDCISEGQNLQDCDYLVNYDIHWNPVRIIQRFGRIDRIGSRNASIQMVNFWPDLELDDYIKLKARVEARMKITVLTATGDDNIIDSEERELEYRKRQLERLQKEVVDLEEMNTGINILDLGLNEFRLDLLDHVKHSDDCEKAPHGLHAVVKATQDCPPGVIFILKNLNQGVNIDRQNRIHPFYMVYLNHAGETVVNHLEPKRLLDELRLLCKGFTEPLMDLCRPFNKETKDGKNMKAYSKLLGDAIASIVAKKEESDIDSLFSFGETSALENPIRGLDDFELICFFVIR